MSIARDFLQNRHGLNPCIEDLKEDFQELISTCETALKEISTGTVFDLIKDEIEVIENGEKTLEFLIEKSERVSLLLHLASLQA